MKQSARSIAALIALSTFTMVGCSSEGGEETVFLYIINGYPAAATMDVISPTGTLTSGARFGDRMARDGPCPPGESCIPIRFDRQFGTDMTIIAENTPQPLGIDAELFAMYPHETATMVLNRKDSQRSVQGTILRHTQTISTDCALTLMNGLSLSNEFMSEGFDFSVAPEFNLAPAEAGFGDERSRPFVTECGALPNGENDTEHDQLMRPGVLAQVAENPWFYPVTCEDQTNREFFCWGWGVPTVDGRSRLYDQGQIITVLDTEEYFECIEGAITINQEEDADSPLPFPAADAQVECPDRPIEWTDVTVDQQAVEDCRDETIKQVFTLEPGGEGDLFTLLGPRACDVEFRIRNEGQDIIFGPEDGDSLGNHQDGALVQSVISVPDGSQHFWVLLGRPVNPIVWQWDSGDTFVDLANFEYFNDQNERVGDYDSD